MAPSSTTCKSHRNDINAAILVFRKLCAIAGNVWPSTLDNQVELCARLCNGSEVHGQDQVTALGGEAARVGIAQLRLYSAVDRSTVPAPPGANPAALKAIAAADVMLFGPGSLYTSTLAHLSVQGMAQAVSPRPATVAKVFIGNILECPETTGRTVAELLNDFLSAGGLSSLTHVLVHRGWVPFERVVDGFRYLGPGRLQASPSSTPCIISDDVEDPWHRGRHDASKVVGTLAGLVSVV